MKAIKTFSFIVAASLIMSGCTTYGQFGAGVTGAAIGSHVGRDIGYLAGGHHHHFGGSSSALGSLIGAGVGAALGVSIQNSIEQSRERRYERTQNQRQYNQGQYGQSQNGAYNGDDYQTGGGAGSTVSSGQSAYNGTMQNSRPTSSNAYVTVQPLTYMDADGDGYIGKGETIEVETYITNTSNQILRNMTISLVSEDTRYVMLSSPLVTTLSPGQKVRYTGRVYCQKAKKNAPVSVSVNVQANGANCNTGSIAIYMK